MNQDIVITLSAREKQMLDVIVMDKDRDEALVFLTALRRKIEEKTIKGMKSHLDK